MLAIAKIAISSLLTSLLTEKFAKWLILYIAEQIVKSTKNTIDDDLLYNIKQAIEG